MQMELATLLAQYHARTKGETVDVERVREILSKQDPFNRSTLLHVTGSALVVDPESGKVLLRWHERMQSWLQVGGHGDPGETDVLAVALRETQEETGLPDVAPWPDKSNPTLLHIVVVPVPAGKGEPEHEHADFRFLLATNSPDKVVAESEKAQLSWLTVDEAMEKTREDNLRETLKRVNQALSEHRNSVVSA
jgi:8-oxo-dGTP pyrophosphatase MutT (NUDIX family)